IERLVLKSVHPVMSPHDTSVTISHLRKSIRPLSSRAAWHYTRRMTKFSELPGAEAISEVKPMFGQCPALQYGLTGISRAKPEPV
ncbi:MAG: hypothetical protein ACRD4Y_08930, partial [Candidatus Acidiferrales bacterium]